MEEARSTGVRVQTLAQRWSDEVRTEYIQPPHNRATAQDRNSPSSSVPIIDLLNFNDRLLESRETRLSIALACENWSAFHVINHCVPSELIQKIRTAGLSFFKDCSDSEKCKYAVDPRVPASEGYGSRMIVVDNEDGNSGESRSFPVLDWRDYFDHHTLPLSRRNPDRWPECFPDYRGIIEEYSSCMELLARKLLRLISESVGLSSSGIEDDVGELWQNITVSYYPPCPQPELTLGLQAHSDMGVITLLVQDDVAGLQVLKYDQWVTVQPQSNAILAILGDQAEIVTNGMYKSAVHRVLTAAHNTRLSVATFHDPAKVKAISPSSRIVTNSKPRYRQVIYGDYVKSWYTKGPDGKRNIHTLLL